MRLVEIRTVAAALVAALLLLTGCGEDLDDATQVDAAAADSDGTDDAAAENGDAQDSDGDDDGDTDNGDGSSSDNGGDDREGWPETINYGLLPSGDETEMMQNHEPFEEYMEACFDHPFELYSATDYVAMIEAVRGDHVHIAKFGPFAYILADERAGVEAFVQGAESEDEAFYQALFISLEEHGLDDLTDLHGEPFGFVDPASASGHIFPRAYMIEQWGVTNDELEEQLGDMVFTGGHEQATMAVLNEEVTVAAISENSWINNIDNDDTYEDHPNFEDLYIMERTDDIPRALEAYQEDLPDSLKEAAAECFENAIDEPSMEPFWLNYNYPAGFIPVSDGDFDVVRDAAEVLEMSPEELLADD